MNLNEMVKQCGTVTVNLGPLLMVVGLATAANDGPDLDDVIALLDLNGSDDDASE